ncbi:hypothetical protein HD806DRAFT_399973 [Xylariaceae sp. AK1471]|nr:hypothetical protein HD806DRAFT_399973 [Xylariaceae sp. AK1471]
MGRFHLGHKAAPSSSSSSSPSSSHRLATGLSTIALTTPEAESPPLRRPLRPATRHEFEIAIICALPLEADAVQALFDQHWDNNGPPYDKASGDPNAYTTGAIGRHNIVLAHMPGMGKANAAAVAASCRASFPNIRLAAVVGICGAVPFGPDGSEIVLGDVIISDGLVQYDFGRRHPDRFVRKNTLSDSPGRPNAEIRALLSKLKSHHNRSMLQEKLSRHLKVVQHNLQLDVQYPGAANDRLFEATYHHTDEGRSCDESRCNGPLVLRNRLEQGKGNMQPGVHFGLIASGDTVMRSGEERDSIARKECVLGFEMEGAGVWDSFPCVVIKGVCDYADSHKTKSWQRYASATAAACLKAFLEFWIPSLSFVPEPHSIVKQPTGTWLAERPETPPQPSFIVPFRRDADFVERKSPLDRIHQACLEPASRAALVGLGGVGKSQLAIEHAYRVRDMFTQQNKQVWAFWIHAGTRARVEEGFKVIADAAKIPGRNQPTADIFQLVYQWLQNERHGQWLMILDSADDINVFYGTDEKGKQQEKRALWTYLPQSSNGSILITTRDKELAFKLTGHQNNVIEVGPMDQDHALALMTTKLGGQLDTDVDTATELVEALEYMPLAISQAAAYIQKRAPRTSIGKYLAEFRKSEQKKSSLLSHDSGDLRRDVSASNSVITTWQISFNYLREKRPSATELLSLMSFFDCQGIPEYLIQPVDQFESDQVKSDSDGENTDHESIDSGETSNDAFEEDITTLRNYCLININDEGNVFKMHGLVQLSTKKWLDAYGKAEKFKEQYISRMAQAFPPGNFENWGTCQKLFPHAEKAIDYRPVDEESLGEWALLLYNSSWYFEEQGKYAVAETMAKLSQDTRMILLGLEHPETLSSMANLASIYRNQGRLKEAESLEVQVMDIRKTVLGLEHAETLSSMANLALTYWNQRRWKEAESLEVQVMDMRKTVLGLEHPETLTSMSNLAATYWHQERWKEAELLEVQVMNIRKTVLGPEHPATLTSMSNLAATYWPQERWKEAELLEVQVMNIRKTVLGPEHPDTLTSMGNLASTYGDQGRWKEAESLEVQVMDTRKIILGPEHPDTLISMSNLAVTWKSQGRDHDALELIEQCHHARIRVLGPEHPDTQSSLSNIQSWRIREPQTRERRWKPMAKNAITLLRTKFRKGSLHRDSEAS